MSENGSNEQGTEQGTSEQGTKERAAHKGVFPTLEEAQQVTPPSDKFRVFIVTVGDRIPAGQKVYAWGQSVNGAIDNAARTAGWTAEVAEPKGPGAITKERVAAKLAELTDEELAEMGLKRAKAKK